MCPSAWVCLSISVHLSFFLTLTSTFLIFLPSIMNPLLDLGARLSAVPHFPLTFRSRHWRQSECQYMEFCQRGVRLQTLHLSFSHTLWRLLALNAYKAFLPSITSTLSSSNPSIFPYLPLILAFAVAGGQTFEYCRAVSVFSQWWQWW